MSFKQVLALLLLVVCSVSHLVAVTLFVACLIDSY